MTNIYPSSSILLRATKSFRKVSRNAKRKEIETIESESKKSVEFEFYYFSKILRKST